MSSTLKRRRGGEPRQDVDPGTASALTDTAVRAHLEQSLAELRATTTRLESLLAALPSPSQRSPQPSSTRAALSEVHAPAQPTSPKPTTAPTESCWSCAHLEQQLSALRTQYERERQAWRAFKSWWLGSLEKRERRRSERRSRRRSEVAASGGGRRQSDVGSSSGGQGQGEGEGERLSRLVGKLDEGTRDVWVRAGIVPPDGGREAQEESELALPLHPSTTVDAVEVNAPAPASVQPSRSAVNPTPASSRARPTPSTSRPNRLSTTHRPSTATAPYIDDTPIRNPLHRRTLHASDCPDCSLFYTHLNDLGTAGQGDVERMACSRHRSTFARADTPEGYWNIGFPSTQEVELINAAARRGRGAGRTREGR